MGRLVFKRFRVTNFRNIDDSGWIPVDRVAAFVGRNESGKTTLLKALHKFNPGIEDPYRPQREFPRERFMRDFRKPGDWAVCAVEFELSPTFRVELSQRLNVSPPTLVICTRYYDGAMKCSYQASISDQPIPTTELAMALDTFAKAARRLVTPSFDREMQTQQLRTELSAWAVAKKDILVPIRDLKSEPGIAILNQLRAEANLKMNPLAGDIVSQLINAIDDILGKASSRPVQSQLEAAIIAELPVFIYFENYGILESAIYLPRFLEDFAKHPNEPRTRTIHALFKHVGLNPQEISELGGGEAALARNRGDRVTDEMIRRDQERKELRSLKLNSASLSITDGFADWFGQRRYRIRYDADGDYFRIWVSDDKRPGVEIELESRSKGFQWFFSFYLVFLFESDEGHKNAVLLLDEPGLNLHPTAQQKLISFFDRLSENNTLLYSTHSPFLIDPKNLHRVSPVFEDETGHSRVVSDGWPADRETTFALQAAAGYNVMQALFRSPKNVLVEDIGHHIYLQILAVLCRAAGFDAIPEDVQVTACGGTRLMAPIAALFATAETQTLVLLDDGEGARRRTPLNPSALLQHAGSGVLTVSEAIGATHVDIEDVFGEGVIVPMVAELLGQDFVLEDADRRQGALVDQIVASATRQQILLPDGWRADVARRVAYVWQTRWPEEIPPEVLERAQVLFRAINARLGIDLFNLVL
ncbi:hypothetical protein C2U72_14850 [Prosthecomicrobium hirschii]|nr:hypothetical protein C2U72_14850 [Prosthecomicrobium hirschii]